MTPYQQTLFKEYPTYEALLSDLHPEKLLIAFSEIEYIEQSISKKRMALRDISELYSKNGRNPEIDYMEEWIRYLAKYIGTKPLSETRAAAYMLYKAYNHFFLTDMKLLLERIAGAVYGRHSLFYGNLDMQRLSYCFGMYNEERGRIHNKFYENIGTRFAKIKEETEAKEKQRIYDEVAKTHTGSELWDTYQQRCRDEIPAIVEARWTEYINTQSDESKQK